MSTLADTRRLSTIRSPGKAPSNNTNVVPAGSINAESVKSPGELTVFVDKLLGDLERRFEQMSSEVLDKVNQMSNRIDNLELSISELISSNIDDTILNTSSTTPYTTINNGHEHNKRHSLTPTSSKPTTFDPNPTSPTPNHPENLSTASANEQIINGPQRATGMNNVATPSLMLTSPSLGELGSLGSFGRSESSVSEEGDSTIKAAD